jgi:hypothetical protein
MAPKRPAGRSTLPKDEARRRYVEIGQLAALEQIKRDSELLDRRSTAVGPFARLDAGAVAGRDGKTRGVISNLFGSQAAFQAETMERALDAADWIESLSYPLPADHADAGAWLDALFAAESARGPLQGGRPKVDYASLWALWLSTVPYGLWSKRISGPSMEENVQWVERLEQVFGEAIDHFGRVLREGTSLTDLAGAVASLIEGVWLNQCLNQRHPFDPEQPIATFLQRSGRLLWEGATQPT